MFKNVILTGGLTHRKCAWYRTRSIIPRKSFVEKSCLLNEDLTALFRLLREE